MILALRRLLVTASTRPHSALIDFSKAFDSVNWTMMEAILIAYNASYPITMQLCSSKKLFLHVSALLMKFLAQLHYHLETFRVTLLHFISS